MPVAVRPGWEEDVPDVVRRLLLCGLGPYPGGSWRAATRFFLHDSGLPRVRTGSALRHTRTATSLRHLCSRLPSCTQVQARRLAHHPGRSSRYGHVRRAAVVSPSEPLVVRYLPTPRLGLPSDAGH